MSGVGGDGLVEHRSSIKDLKGTESSGTATGVSKVTLPPWLTFGPGSARRSVHGDKLLVSHHAGGPTMNAFYEHHQDSIRFAYRCFDRILLNGLIQPFQQPERVIGFFNTYRDHQRVSRDALRGIANQFHHWVEDRAQTWDVPIVEAPPGRRDDFVDRYFKRPQPDDVVVILKAREPARILIAIGNAKDDRWHLQFAQRWVMQYNFYLHDRFWGRMFVRVCPYFPFSARVCLNQHHWLANQLRAEGIGFQQCANAFLKCAQPQRLQALADALTARDLMSCGEKWLAQFTPFFTDRERRRAGCQHRLFVSQIE